MTGNALAPDIHDAGHVTAALAAIPADVVARTPAGRGARQPGMTGRVEGRC